MWWLFLPNLYVRGQPDGSVVIDVQVLGEYFANATRIRITEVATGTTVFDARASGKFFPIWTFPLRAGINKLSLDRDRTAIDVPRLGESFELKSDVWYRVTFWAIKEGLHVHTSQRFRVQVLTGAPTRRSSRHDVSPPTGRLVTLPAAPAPPAQSPESPETPAPLAPGETRAVAETPC